MSAAGRFERIVVYGVTGSGKTTVSRRLGALLGLPVIELDSLFWEPGWTATPEDRFREKVQRVLAAAPEGWVCDGNYSRVRPEVIGHADTVVWLRLPWRLTFWRLFWRTMSRAWSREVLWNENRESWRTTFFSHESILWWSLRYHRKSMRNIAAGMGQAPAGASVVILRSTREVETFLQDVEASADERHIEAASSG